jgi:hypothetical protein
MQLLDVGRMMHLRTLLFMVKLVTMIFCAVRMKHAAVGIFLKDCG